MRWQRGDDVIFTLFSPARRDDLSRCAVWTGPQPIRYLVDKIRSDRQGQAEFSQVQLESAEPQHSMAAAPNIHTSIGKPWIIFKGLVNCFLLCH